MRLFVAVWPPGEVIGAVGSAVESMRAAHRDEAAALRWAGPDQWHVTLRFLGNAEEDQARAALGEAVHHDGFGPATAVLGPATGRFGRRVLHVPVAGLDGLAAAVGAATAGVGEPPEERRFAGHLTLARARERRGADLDPFCGVSVAGRWPVCEVALVASHMGRGGTRYEVVETLPLRGTGVERVGRRGGRTAREA